MTNTTMIEQLKAISEQVDTNEVHSQFKALWEIAPKVDFKVEWNDGTDYMDGVLRDCSLPAGIHAFCTDVINNRKGIICTGGHGNTIIIFERYTDGDSGILVTNMTTGLQGAWNILNGSGTVKLEGIKFFTELALAIAEW